MIPSQYIMPLLIPGSGVILTAPGKNVKPIPGFEEIRF